MFKLVSCHVAAGDHFTAINIPNTWIQLARAFTQTTPRWRTPPLFTANTCSWSHTQMNFSLLLLFHTPTSSFTSSLSVDELKLPATLRGNKRGKAGWQKSCLEVLGRYCRGSTGQKEAAFFFRDKQRGVWGWECEIGWVGHWLCGYSGTGWTGFRPNYLVLPLLSHLWQQIGKVDEVNQIKKLWKEGETFFLPRKEFQHVWGWRILWKERYWLVYLYFCLN